MYNTKKFPVYLINRQLYFSKGKIGVGWGEVDGGRKREGNPIRK